MATAKLVVAGGAGMLADGYDLSVVNLVMVMLENVYPSSLTPQNQGLIVSITILGVVIGMVSFGTVADICGRKIASIITAALVALGSILSGCAFQEGHFIDIVYQLAFFRFLLGLGIGGEYPLSAAISTEVSFRRDQDLCCSRSDLLIVNMILYNVGVCLQASLVLLLLGLHLKFDLMWRLSLGLGAVPSLIVLMIRVSMEEPEDANSVVAANGRRRSTSLFIGNIVQEVSQRTGLLFGACICWALFNFVSYSMSSFSHVMCDRIFEFRRSDNNTDILFRDAVYALLLAVFACLSFGTLLVTSRPSPRSLQLAGFVGTAFLLALCSLLMSKADGSFSTVEMMLQALTVCSLSVIGASTYMVPTQSFPPSVRASCVGLAAASGKIGALLGTAVFPSAEAAYGLQPCLYVGSCVMLLGAAATLTFSPEDVKTTA